MNEQDPRFWLYQQFMNHTAWDADEEHFRVQTLKFIEETPDCFERSHLEGHFTAEAWILNREHTKVLMTHHLQLNRWFQLGGHSDGDPDMLRVALKEAEEESGLQNIKALSENMFDIDIHRIPEKKGIPTHLHYGVGFLLEADENEALTVPENESKELRWVPITEITKLDPDQYRLRMLQKLSHKYPQPS